MKTESHLLQASVNSINSLLDKYSKQRDLWRSWLASRISSPSMQQYQEFRDKVREFRYLKVRERQINKFNRLLQKEGNITWLSNPNTYPGSSKGVGNANPQPGRSAGST